MISMYGVHEAKLQPLGADMTRIGEAVWIDVLRPTPEEEAELERILRIEVPTREEMQEIELSSRLYMEGDAAFMTANILSHTDADDPVVSPITFILTGSRLISIRYEEPRTITLLVARAQRLAVGCTGADAILASLLEAVIERLADILERAAHDIDSLSRNIFGRSAAAAPAETRGSAGRKSSRPRGPDFQKVLSAIGLKGDLTSHVRDSLVTFQRLFTYLSHVMAQRKPSDEVRDRISTLSRDAQALSDHASFLSQKITFLLDATLGMINIEQNAIIKIFSVAAVVFLPPTLIASIYGMNFDHMPELHWMVGYPFALGLMVLSAVLPYLFFKRRGWL